MKKFGLIGNKISYSLSPKIHGIIYAELGLNASYELIDIPEGGIGEHIELIKSLDGFNVTQPHKRAIIQFLKENNSPIEAVNAVRREGEDLLGFNTDIFGFERDVLTGFGSVEDKTALIIGAGGFASAAAFELAKLGANVFIKNRTLEKAQELCKKSGARLWDKSVAPQVVVNCSSAELFGSLVDVSSINLTKLEYAYDAIYKDTQFLSTMQNAGAKKCLNGLNTLIYQAIAAVEIFTKTELNDEETEKIKDKIRSELI